MKKPYNPAEAMRKHDLANLSHELSYYLKIHWRDDAHDTYYASRIKTGKTTLAFNYKGDDGKVLRLIVPLRSVWNYSISTPAQTAQVFQRWENYLSPLNSFFREESLELSSERSFWFNLQ